MTRITAGVIESGEVIKAVQDFFADRITSIEVLDVVRRYFNPGASS